MGHDSWLEHCKNSTPLTKSSLYPSHNTVVFSKPGPAFNRSSVAVYRRESTDASGLVSGSCPPHQGITHINHVHVHQQFDNRTSATGTHSWRDTGFRVDIVETVSETLRLRFLVERISNLPSENKNLASQWAQLPLERLAIVVFHRYAKMGPRGSKGWPVNRMISGMLLYNCNMSTFCSLRS